MKRSIAAVLLCLPLAACFGPPLKENYFTLSAIDGGATTPAAATPVVLVGPVSVPQAVDRLAMVIHAGPNRVEIDDANRWAEPLKAAIPRVLAENLRRELGSSQVFSGRPAAMPAPQLHVSVDIQRFESSLETGATLEAAWSVAPASGEARTGRTAATEAAPTRDAAGLAAAHSRALARLARDIAAAIRR